MIDIKVYNAEQIGGCFTVITTSKAKIMIDYGLPLPGAKTEQEDIDWKNDTVDAVFITHYHGDHVGKILDIPEPIPIFMGKTTRQIMLNIHEALVRVPKLQEEQEKWIRLLRSNRIEEVQENAPITKIKGITVTPYSVDHSAYDAYMYLIEADGKVILHTGDFRGHGYRGSKMLKVIEYYVHKNGRKVDYLITEGTMMGDRKDEKVKKESELYKEALELFKEHRHVFLVISSTNLDSLVSFYHAALDNKMYMYCYNYYFYKQLKAFSETAGEKSPWYQFEDVYTIDFEKQLSHELWDKDKTQEELMREHGFLCVIKAEDKYNEWIEKFKEKNPLVIYSMWGGYIDKATGKDAYNKEWADFFAPYQESKQFRDMHTSGHATAKMIASVINAVDPQEEIIPMHTENVEGFKELRIDTKYKKMIRTDRKEKNVMEKYQVWAEAVQKELQSNTDWVEVYKNYAEDMLENKSKIEECKKRFNVPKPLECYVTLGNIAKGKTIYDLRYLGQSVGEIHIENDKPILVVSEKKAEASEKYFGYEIGGISGELWATGAKAKAFRNFYKKVVDKEKFPRQKEHMVEAKMFQELSKSTGIDKQLKYIQPIKFAGCFTHMKTAVAASKSKDGHLSVTNAGGEIDIFCRRKINPRESRLTVIEVKDKVERNESFEEAMFQAISYAVFVRELLKSSAGSMWMQIWGMNSKKTDGITINAVVAIPISNEVVPDFHGQKILLENDIIELHYMALKKDVLSGEGAVYFETKL